MKPLEEAHRCSLKECRGLLSDQAPHNYKNVVNYNILCRESISNIDVNISKG